ncbi:MAG TPA: hypothetical protein VF585_11605 [Chthoniobacterales bacterium]|jgi:hypothetical protein
MHTISLSHCRPAALERFYSGFRFPRAICILLWVCAFSHAGAAIYDLNDTSRKLRLNIPDSVLVVRGILVYGNGAGGDSTGQATNSQLVAVAESIGFAVLATGNWGNFPADSEINYFESRIAQFAGASGHPELINAPWLPMGHSNGGQMSYGMNAKRPHKVIGFITSKGCCYNFPMPVEAALLTPGMLIAGQIDTEVRRTNIKALFTNNRPRGALWAWVEEENSGHEEGASQELILAFLLECYRLRYPSDQSTLAGPIVLKNLNAYDGWLVDQTTWNSGFTKIFPYEEAPGNPKAYGWVPNERIARIYQTFSSYGKASTSAAGSSGVLAGPGNVTYNVNLTGLNWTSVEFFEGKRKVGEATPAGGNTPAVSYAATEGRLYSNLGVVTMSDGSKKATPLRRVFVKGPKPASAFQRWAATNLPAVQAGPNDVLFGDGITNLMRFAFSLGTARDFPKENLPVASIETIDGANYLQWTYQIDEAAIAAGLNVMPETSADLSAWRRTAGVDGLTNPLAHRVGNVVTVRLPTAASAGFVRMKISDTSE